MGNSTHDRHCREIAIGVVCLYYSVIQRVYSGNENSKSDCSNSQFKTSAGVLNLEPKNNQSREQRPRTSCFCCVERELVG
jgi:hypothetical protein